MINFILWLIFGGIAGWIASMIMGTDAQQGLLMNIIVGIIGAFIGGFIARLLGLGVGAGFSIVGLIVAVVGACILIWLVKMFTGRRV